MEWVVSSDRTTGRKVFSRNPARSLHFWGATLFLMVESLTAAYIVVHDWGKLSTEAFRWLLLAMAAAWSFWAKVLIAHVTVHRCISAETGAADDDRDTILTQTAELAYNGFGFALFVVFGLLVALGRVLAGR